MLIALSVWVNYMVFAEWRYGRTIGKAALGIKVLRLDGGDLSWNRALVRNLLRVPDLIAIFFTVPRSEHRQRLGDRAAKTVVMRWQRDAALPARSPRAAPNASATWGGARVLAGLGAAAPDHRPRGGRRLGVRPGPRDAGRGAGPPGAPRRGDGLRPLPGSPGRTAFARPAALGLGPSLRAPVTTAVVGYLAYLGCALVISALLSPEQEDITRELGVDEGALGAIAAFFLIVIAAPVAEEIFFRGFMFAGHPLARLVRGRRARLVRDLGPLPLHRARSSWPVVLQLSVFGVILCAVYERTGSIRPDDRPPHAEQRDRVRGARRRMIAHPPSRPATIRAREKSCSPRGGRFAGALAAPGAAAQHRRKPSPTPAAASGGTGAWPGPEKAPSSSCG